MEDSTLDQLSGINSVSNNKGGTNANDYSLAFTTYQLIL